jgi:hypothetical protein
MICYDVDAALAEVPVNVAPLIDNGDFKTIEATVAYNAAGMALYWHFTTCAGATTATAVTPTTSGTYDWAHQAQGMYTIEIPASGGASINNDTEGFGYFTGVCDGVLPWRGPTLCFRAAGLNNLLIEDAFSATRGLGGTALPNAAADAAGGLPISDAGGIDLDAQLVTKINDILTDTGTTLQGELDGIQADTEDIQSKIGSPVVSLAADIAAIEAQTDDIGAGGAGLSAIPWNAAWDAEVQSEVTDALNAYDPPTKAETDAAALAAFTTALTESYASDGAAFTPAQALFMLWALLAERGISGTTLTASKLDGTTAAMTFTLDSATTPNTQTRAT